MKIDGLGAWSLEKDWCGLTFHHQNMSHLHNQLSSRQTGMITILLILLFKEQQKD